jgi:hypothetical protein
MRLQRFANARHTHLRTGGFMNQSAVKRNSTGSTSAIVSLLALALALALVASVASAAPLIFTVTNTADSGNGSLRQAILDANENTGPDTIQFNIPSDDSGCNAVTHVCTIKPSASSPSTWPHLTSPVNINGYSQSGSHANTFDLGSDAVLLIELDATNLTDHALYLAGPLAGGDSSGSTIQGLVISHVNSGLYAICIGCYGGNSNNHSITGNFLGTDATGTASSSQYGGGISLNGSTGTIIGGVMADKRNVIATGGEAVALSGSNNTTVQGNYIGVDKSGTIALASGRGIDVGGSSGTLIGGAMPGAGNVVGHWSDNGIILQGSGNNNLVQGNLVGTDATGTVDLGGQIGVEYFGSGTGSKIGGTAAGEGNVINGGSISGVDLYGDTSPDLVVQGNLITGNAEGIIVDGGAGIIGGTAAGAGNRIALNSSLGVSISGGAKNVPILGNEIYANGSLGISLSGTGTPTPNDDGDADTGNNNEQNYPVISSVTIGPSTTVHVSGSLNSTPGSAYRVEFFANASCDPSHNGQGKKFIGFANVTTTPNPVAFGTPSTLNFTVPADRHVITATATELVGAGLVPGSTSEFSACSTQDTIFTDGLEGD